MGVERLTRQKRKHCCWENSPTRKSCALLPIAFMRSFPFDTYDVFGLHAAAVGNCTGSLFAAPFHCDVRPYADRIFQSYTRAAVRSVFERRRCYAGSPVLIVP